MAGLAVSLGLDGTTFRLTCTPDKIEHLRTLALSMPASRAISRYQLDVEAESFLRQIAALRQWPDSDVTWSEPAARLAQDSIADAKAAKDALHGGPPVSAIHESQDQDWRAPLTSFQRRDLRKLIGLRHAANFSVPGAGKTRVALASYSQHRGAGEVQRLLVVAPKSAFESWQTEACAVWPQNPIAIHVLDKTIPPGTELLLVNYERLASTRASLAAWLMERPSMMILDEAHRMKLGAAGTYGSACLALGPLARHRLILTGTPAPNGVEDLKNLMGFVWPGLGRQVVSEAVGNGDLRSASQRLKPFFTRTTKDELGLPPVNSRLHALDLPPLHGEIYKALVGQLSGRAHARADDFEALGRILVYLVMAADSPALLALGASRYEPLDFRVPPLSPPEGGALFELLQDLPSYEMSPKYREALAIVAANASVGRKTLVWSTFIRSLTSLGRMMEIFNPAIVHGGTEDREEEIKRFREDPDCMVLLSNPATLGEGISLHHVCHDAVFVDRDFAAGRYLQSLDRIHRLGLPPETETNVTVLVSRGTIDEVIHARLADKLLFMSGILDDPNIEVLGDLNEEAPTSGGMDLADLRAIMGHVDAIAE